VKNGPEQQGLGSWDMARVQLLCSGFQACEEVQSRRDLVLGIWLGCSSSVAGSRLVKNGPQQQGLGSWDMARVQLLCSGFQACEEQSRAAGTWFLGYGSGAAPL